MVCGDSVPAGINTGDHRSAIYHRCAGINGMVIAKSDSLARKLPKRRRILLAHEIRSHPVPDNNHDVPRFVRFLCPRRRRAKDAPTGK